MPIRPLRFPAGARSARSALRGFTVVELMVAMVAGLLIILALVSMWISVSRSNSEMNRANRLIENGRFALQILADDVIHAGFWGGFVPRFDDLSVDTAPGDEPSVTPDPCTAPTNWLDVANVDLKNSLIGMPLQTYHVPQPVPTPTVPVCSAVVTAPKARTDVLIVRHAETCVAGAADCSPDTTGGTNADVFFQPSRCNTEITGGTTHVFGTSTFTLTNRDCSTVAEKRRYVSNLYYVRNYANTVGDNIPTLMRSDFGVVAGQPRQRAAQALVEGIEGFRVELGIDSLSDTGAAVDNAAAIDWADASIRKSPTNRGDGMPDGSYVHCAAAGTSPCEAATLANVVSARIYVLVRGEQQGSDYTDTKTYTLGSQTLGPFNDRYKRHVFATTVRLQNVSSRRETPP